MAQKKPTDKQTNHIPYNPNIISLVSLLIALIGIIFSFISLMLSFQAFQYTKNHEPLIVKNINIKFPKLEATNKSLQKKDDISTTGVGHINYTVNQGQIDTAMIYNATKENSEPQRLSGTKEFKFQLQNYNNKNKLYSKNILVLIDKEQNVNMNLFIQKFDIPKLDKGPKVKIEYQNSSSSIDKGQPTKVAKPIKESLILTREDLFFVDDSTKKIANYLNLSKHEAKSILNDALSQMDSIKKVVRSHFD